MRSESTLSLSLCRHSSQSFILSLSSHSLFISPPLFHSHSILQSLLPQFSLFSLPLTLPFSLYCRRRRPIDEPREFLSDPDRRSLLLSLLQQNQKDPQQEARREMEDPVNSMGREEQQNYLDGAFLPPEARPKAPTQSQQAD